jgi:hypothetical protein
VPAAAAERIHPAPIAGAEGLVVLAHIGDIGDDGRQPVAIRIGGVRRGGLQRAKIQAELDLLPIVDDLRGEHQHRITCDRLLDECHVVRRDRLAKVDALDARA